MTPGEPAEAPLPAALPWSRADGWCLAGLAAAVGVLFGRVLGYPFVNWDDVHFLIENPIVQSLTLSNLGRVWVPGGVPRELIYIPLTYLSHLLEATLFGLSPRVVHGVNLALHLVNTGLVYGFCRQLSRRRAVALLAALPFAVHPLQVEAVAWAMGRKDLLGTLFGLLALILYVRYVRTGERSWLGATLLLFALAVLAKPTFIVLPLVMVLIDFQVEGPAEPRHWGHKIPFVLIALLTYWINSRMPAQVSAEAVSPWLRLVCVPWIGEEWVRRFLLLGMPVPFYGWPEADDWPRLAALGTGFAAVLATVLWLAWRRGWRTVRFGLLFFAIAFLPAVSIILQPRDFITADRYGYFPLIGVFYLVAVGLIALPGRARLAVRGAYGVWLAAALAVAWMQVGVWSNSVALWSVAMAHNPDLAIIRNNLGMAYVDAGQPERAIAEFKQGQLLEPHLATLYNNLGRVYLDQGLVSNALAQFHICLELMPRDAAAHRNLGDALLANGQHAAAVAAYRRALELKPDFADAYLSLGNALSRDNLAEAAAAYRQGLVHSPRHGALYFNLGLIEERRGNPTEALDAYSLAVRYDPGLAVAWYNLGTLYLGSGHLREAQEAFREALRLNEDADTCVNLGIVVQEQGDFAGAIDHYRRALRLGTPHAARVWFLIAQAQRRLGRLPEARQAVSQALALDPELPGARQLLQELESGR